MIEIFAVPLGVVIGLALIYGMVRLALKFPSRSVRTERPTWDDTNHISRGLGGGQG